MKKVVYHNDTLFLSNYIYLSSTLRVLSSVAAALVTLNRLTAKLNPVILPIMDSVKKEEDHHMQALIFSFYLF